MEWMIESNTLAWLLTPLLETYAGHFHLVQWLSNIFFSSNRTFWFSIKILNRPQIKRQSFWQRLTIIIVYLVPCSLVLSELGNITTLFCVTFLICKYWIIKNAVLLSLQSCYDTQMSAYVWTHFEIVMQYTNIH